MARKTNSDRGLIKRKNCQGQTVWYVRVSQNGQIRWFGSFPTKTEARDCYEEVKTDQRRGVYFAENLKRRGAKRLADAIVHYMALNRKKTIANDRLYARFWQAQLPQIRLVDISPAQLDEVKDELLKKGLSNQSVLHYLKFLRHILNRAVRDRHLNQNPFSQIEMPKVPKGRLRYLSLEEEQRLSVTIGPTYAPWVRLAILTGLRQAEQFQLKWTDVDLERGMITLPQTKADECQLVYMNQEAIDILKGFTSWKDSRWVFPSQTKGTHLNPKNFYHRVYVPALRKAKLKNVDWHTLRHTFASRLGMSGATEQEIAACLRHSTTALVKRYTHLSQPHLHLVAEKVSQFGRPEGTRRGRTPSVDKSEITTEGGREPLR